jgi:ribosomal protein S18 acetylase RimI-like enzyme
MTFTIRAMKSSEAQKVAAFVQALASDLSLGVTPKLTGDALLEASDLVSVAVAEGASGELCGACLSLMTYSTFRAAKGLYVVDLYVPTELRGRQIGQRLLRHAASEAARNGARFIKLEVDTTNQGAARFYERLGFVRKAEDQLYVLENNALQQFLNTN